MTSTGLLSVLQEFHQDKLALRERHVAVARLVSDYAFNNTYQYVIAREDVHLSWLESAIAELGGTPSAGAPVELPALRKRESVTPLVGHDSKQAAAFVDKWRLRLDSVNNARHRGMMQVVLGEVLEHKRFFDQMLSGREDLLGRRSNGPAQDGTGGGVLSVRWIE